METKVRVETKLRILAAATHETMHKMDQRWCVVYAYLGIIPFSIKRLTDIVPGEWFHTLLASDQYSRTKIGYGFSISKKAS
jgi:hypothetical protein